MNKALVIFTKVPMSGLTKTRLSPAISLEQSAELHKSFLLDEVALLRKIKEKHDISIIIAYTPENALDRLKKIISDPEVQFITQGGGDLGKRMDNVFGVLFNMGYESVVMIGTDVPTLPKKIIENAFKELEENDVVIGPSIDGGYYLIALKSLNQELFKDIEWGSGKVLNQTIKKIKDIGLSLGYLDVWYDVDTIDDLRFLIAHINYLKYASKGNIQIPEETVKTLKKINIVVRN